MEQLALAQQSPFEMGLLAQHLLLTAQRLIPQLPLAQPILLLPLAQWLVHPVRCSDRDKRTPWFWVLLERLFWKVSPVHQRKRCPRLEPVAV